jgi:hypothetical protein
MKGASDRQRSELNAHFRTNPAPSLTLNIGKHLYTVADTFIQAQQQRHTADYDNSTQWTRTEVLIQIDLVTAAFESWNTIRKEPIAQAYLVSLLSKDRG